MNKEEAIEIHTYALKAKDALAELEQIVLSLPAEERASFAQYLGEITLALSFGILPKIYDRLPELRPPQEPSTISSHLEWANVNLPAGTSVADLDAAIFASIKPNWLKTARIITDAASILKSRSMELPYEEIGARIKALADQGRIDSQGNVRMWRHSEVRLPASC
jgi:hypothetical protein